MTRGGKRPGAGRPKGTKGGGWGTGAGGRPKSESPKSKRASARVTETQYAWLEQTAVNENTTPSALVIDALERRGMPKAD